LSRGEGFPQSSPSYAITDLTADDRSSLVGKRGQVSSYPLRGGRFSAKTFPLASLEMYMIPLEIRMVLQNKRIEIRQKKLFKQPDLPKGRPNRKITQQDLPESTFRLTEVIDELGISREDFSLSIGYGSSTIRGIIHQRRPVDKLLAYAIEGAYRVNAEWLLNGKI
jgi:hypothetical protein